jgi:EAL domain-containing protein (putative c-di-GMP-specific phosphodiesterase class I)
MYRAKETRTPFEVYRLERDSYRPSRLALAGEMQRAIEEGELVAWFQPGGRPGPASHHRRRGARALAAPGRGLVGPAEFVPVVEQTNLLRPMTLRVLDMAIGRCATWHANGLRFNVSVNLSARDLVDESAVR